MFLAQKISLNHIMLLILKLSYILPKSMLHNLFKRYYWWGFTTHSCQSHHSLQQQYSVRDKAIFTKYDISIWLIHNMEHLLWAAPSSLHNINCNWSQYNTNWGMDHQYCDKILSVSLSLSPSLPLCLCLSLCLSVPLSLSLCLSGFLSRESIHWHMLIFSYRMPIYLSCCR